MTNIHISIVIPLYNKQNSIAATLQSVFAQTYTNYEVIVVDDGSTDESFAVAKQVIGERLEVRGKVIQKANGGVCSARNRGIQEAKYDYIALLDGDDQWDEHYLEEQVKLIHDFPEAKLWGINFAELSKGELIRKLPTGLPDGYRGYVENYFQIPGRISDLYCSSSVVSSKDVFERVGYFDERILEEAPQALFISAVCCVHGTNHSLQYRLCLSPYKGTSSLRVGAGLSCPRILAPALTASQRSAV